MCGMCGAGGELCKYEVAFSQGSYSTSSQGSMYETNMSAWYQ